VAAEQLARRQDAAFVGWQLGMLSGLQLGTFESYLVTMGLTDTTPR
jgi:hypothetical protein